MARSQLLLGLLILLVSAALATLVVAIRMLSLRRGTEPALLTARGPPGASWPARRGMTDAAAAGHPSRPDRPAYQQLASSRCSRTWPAGPGGQQLTPGQPRLRLAGRGAVAAECAVIIALPSLRPPPSPLPAAIRARAAAGHRRRRVARADLALIALAVGAGWRPQHYSGSGRQRPAGPPSASTRSLVSAPVLALAAGTLLILRLLPLVTRLADAAAAKRGITVPVAALADKPQAAAPGRPGAARRQPSPPPSCC